MRAYGEGGEEHSVVANAAACVMRAARSSLPSVRHSAGADGCSSGSLPSVPSSAHSRDSSDSYSGAPPLWMEDSQSSECLLCMRAFTLLVRRHHCRHCGILVCSKCSTHRNTSSQRVCDSCFTQGRGSGSSMAPFHDRMSSPPTPRPHSSSFSNASTPMLTPTRAKSVSVFVSPAAGSTSTAVAVHARSSSANLPHEIEEETTPAVWMEDKQSAECVLCFRAFTVMLRRHHCRQCGILVCSKCSSHRSSLSTPKGRVSDQRVCDTCFDASAGSTHALAPAVGGPTDSWTNDARLPPPPMPVHVDHHEVTSRAVLADPHLALPSLPPWVYAFAGAGLGELVPIGRLYVRVICAVNLPAMNRLMSTTDPYCTLHCAGASARTRIVTNSLNPQWDQEYYFDVLNASEDALTVVVYDWDQLGKNKEVAFLTIPLSELSHSHRVTRWYEITHLSELARRAPNMRDMSLDLLADEVRRRDRALLAEAGIAGDDTPHAHEVRVARPRMQLELQYVYNDTAAFFSYLTSGATNDATTDDADAASLASRQNASPVSSEAFAAPVVFDIDALYRDLFHLVDLLHPLTSRLAAIGPLLAWSTPFRSFLAVVALLLVCTWPFLALVLVEALALHGLADSYTRRIDLETSTRARELARVRAEAEDARLVASRKRGSTVYRGARALQNMWTGKDDDVPALVNARRQSLLARLNPLTTAPDGRALDAKERGRLGALVTGALNGLLGAFGMHGSLTTYHAMIRSICTQLESAHRLVSWEDRRATRMVVWALLALMVYSLLLPQRHLFLVGGLYVLTMNTPPVKRITAAAQGIARYMDIRRSRRTTPMEINATATHTRLRK